MADIKIGLDAALILAGAIYGFILGITLLSSRSGNSKAKVFAALMVLTYALHITEFAALLSGHIFKFPSIIGFTFPLLMMVGPFFVLHAEALHRSDFSWNRRHWLYFVPFVVWQLYFLRFYTLTQTEKIQFLSEMAAQQFHFVAFSYSFSTLLVNFICLYLAHRHINRFEKWIEQRSSSDDVLKLKWTRKLAFAFTILLGLNIIAFVMSKVDNTYLYQMEVAFVLSMIAIVIMIGTNAQVQAQMYLEPEEASIRAQKYQTSSLDEQKVISIKKVLIQYMEEERPYLDSELKISDLALQLDIPAHHLSQTINQEFGSNFFDFVNRYRIESAKLMLRNKRYDFYKILAVAIENGFSNKASFNRVFKKYTGTTPSEYRNDGVKELV